jgi:hypothetical protein
MKDRITPITPYLFLNARRESKPNSGSGLHGFRKL